MSLLLPSSPRLALQRWGEVCGEGRGEDPLDTPSPGGRREDAELAGRAATPGLRAWPRSSRAALTGDLGSTALPSSAFRAPHFHSSLSGHLFPSLRPFSLVFLSHFLLYSVFPFSLFLSLSF